MTLFLGSCYVPGASVSNRPVPELPQTRENFGGDAQYGTPDLSWYGGTLISAPRTNPEFSGACRT